ncbi:hypothetical protein C8R47DRAFT_519746 [Mycena vitilis]|nr:hypothetical protein C8R47DRAFT_519746 [Mycena vitilis]
MALTQLCCLCMVLYLRPSRVGSPYSQIIQPITPIRHVFFSLDRVFFATWNLRESQKVRVCRYAASNYVNLKCIKLLSETLLLAQSASPSNLNQVSNKS